MTTHRDGEHFDDSRSPSPGLVRRPSTAGDLLRVLASVPADASLHIYVSGTTASVQAEWVNEDDHIQNPVVLRATFDLRGAAGAQTEHFDEGKS